jgi:hypothetical protein
MENTLLFVTMQTKVTVYAINNVSLGIFLVEPIRHFTFQNACITFFILIIIDGYLGTCQVSRYFKIKIKTWCNLCGPFNTLKPGYSQTNGPSAAVTLHRVLVRHDSPNCIWSFLLRGSQLILFLWYYGKGVQAPFHECPPLGYYLYSFPPWLFLGIFVCSQSDYHPSIGRCRRNDNHTYLGRFSQIWL